MADKHEPRSYAPGYGLFIPQTSASKYGPQDCPGCDQLHASPDCAACGKPTAVVLPPIRTAGARHALPLCLRCYAVVLGVCSPERAEELRLEGQREKKRARDRAWRAARRERRQQQQQKTA